jgi:hypothetical protein
MVKLLSDICLNVIHVSLDKMPDIGLYLPTVYKEMLIERLAWHDMISPDYLPYISRQLFSSSLRRINFYKCEQVNDTVLQLLAAAKCKLEYLTVNQCQDVTGELFCCCWLLCHRSHGDFLALLVEEDLRFPFVHYFRQEQEPE